MTESIDDSLSLNNDETLVDEEELTNFTATLDQFTPAIPETVTKFYMRQCGLQTEDERVVKLLSVSVQKFMSDVINDCHQLHKLREKSTNRPAAPAPTASANSQPAAADVAASATDPSTGATSGKKPLSSTNQTLTLNDLTHVLD